MQSILYILHAIIYDFRKKSILVKIVNWQS